MFCRYLGVRSNLEAGQNSIAVLGDDRSGLIGGGAKGRTAQALAIIIAPITAFHANPIRYHNYLCRYESQIFMDRL